MTTLELKNKVIGKINQIDDEEILADVYKLLENSTENEEIFRITDNHKIAIEEALEQIKRGDYLTNNQANNEINQWLKE